MEEATEAGDTDAINRVQEQLNEYYETIDAEAEARDSRRHAKLQVRQAKRDGSLGIPQKKLVWAEGGRELVTGIVKKSSEFQVAAEGNLAKSNRDIGRWDTSFPYDNARGVKRGEILMVLGKHYEDHNGKKVVDVMIGPDIVKGIPAYALRPLE